MNRRLFLQRSAKLSALLAIAPMILASGCSESIKDLLNTVIEAGEGLIKVVAPSASWFNELQGALNALQTAETSWMNGGGVQVIESALSTVQLVLGAIPVTAAYAPLVNLLIAAADGLLEKLYPQGVPSANAKVTMARTTRATLKKPSLLETHSSAFKKQWNAEAATLSLPAAKI